MNVKAVPSKITIMKNMLTLKVFENSKRVSFSKVLCGVLCIVYTCVDDAFPDFI